MGQDDSIGRGGTGRVAVAVHRCFRTKERNTKKICEATAFGYQLLRRNPDVLTRLVDVKNVWRRRWIRHADGLLRAEREMLQRGWEVPSSQARENLLGWKRTYEESVQT